MSDLSGMELRRAALQALGWRQVDLISKVVWRCALSGKPYDHSNPGCFGEAHELPAIESDPAVSEPMFLEWCHMNCYHFHMKTAIIFGEARYGIVLCSTQECRDTVTHNHYTSIGSTPSEARARAIVTASQRTQANANEPKPNPAGAQGE